MVTRPTPDVLLSQRTLEPFSVTVTALGLSTVMEMLLVGVYSAS